MAGGKQGPGGATPAINALDRAGVGYTLLRYEHDPRAESYGEEAAEALGVDPVRVFKTLLADLDGALVVAVLPVPERLDLKSLARVLGGRRAVMADVVDAQRATGYVAGGISPIGQRRPHRTVLDSTAREHEAILVSAGRRGLELELGPADLVAITGAIVHRVGRTHS